MPRSHRPRIFLSHSHTDRTFAKSLAGKFERLGADVWIDEAKVDVGDSLTERISEGIRSAEYFVVVLSPGAVDSHWVRQEVQIALTQSASGAEFKIIPILCRPCQIPDSLRDVLAEDLSSWFTRGRALKRVLRRLGLFETSGEVQGELETYVSKHRVFKNAFDELAEYSDLRTATARATVCSNIPRDAVDMFWLLLVRRFSGARRRNAAAIAARFVESHGVGYAAVEFAVSKGELDEEACRWVARGLGSETASVESIIWAHRVFWPRVSTENEYNEALRVQLATALKHCHQDVLGRVTRGDRGPGSCSIDRMFDLIRYAPDPSPFISKWYQWIVDGYFDHRNLPGDASALILYAIYNEAIQERVQAMEGLIQDTMKHVAYLLCNDRSEEGIYHLKSMASQRFAYSSRMAEMVEERRHNINYTVMRAIEALLTQLQRAEVTHIDW